MINYIMINYYKQAHESKFWKTSHSLLRPVGITTCRTPYNQPGYLSDGCRLKCIKMSVILDVLNIPSVADLCSYPPYPPRYAGLIVANNS